MLNNIGLPGLLLIAVVLLVLFGVEEPNGANAIKATPAPIHLADVAAMGWRYWNVVGLGVIFTLARFSEAFLVLKAQAVGLPIALVPVVLVVMNVVYAAVAAPVGVCGCHDHSRVAFALSSTTQGRSNGRGAGSELTVCVPNFASHHAVS